MDVYLDLLEEHCGIIKPIVVQEAYTPQRTDSEVDDNYDYIEWGYDAFGTRMHGPADSCVTYALNYNDQVRIEAQKIHRYIRRERFKPILHLLLAVSAAKIPARLITLLHEQSAFYNMSPPRIWNTVRQILKLNGYNKFYNHIPVIIKQLTGQSPLHNSTAPLASMMNDFERLSASFDLIVDDLVPARSYFLNMRFIALKLIVAYDIKYPYHTPFTRTLRRGRILEDLFVQLVDGAKFIDSANKHSKLFRH